MSSTKRKRDAAENVPRKNAKTSPEDWVEGRTNRELAKPYLLAVAKMPVDALDTTWSVGRNRALDHGHVRRLRETFATTGLERNADENRLLLLCSADEVRRAKSEHGPPDGDVLTFFNWATINDQAEVMAGQHRIQALREYVRKAKAPPSEMWWTCELYDRDRLPSELNIKMRINRRDPGLPDNQGQIWLQLMSIASDPAGSLAPGNTVKIDNKLVGALRLGGEKNFPTRRLVSIWNRKAWRERVTKWCSTRLGMETFNISNFEWLARLRIDEYWFDTLDAALHTLEALPLDEKACLGREEWSRLARALDGKTRDDLNIAVDGLFYTEKKGRRTRTENLLPHLSDEAYEAVVHAAATGNLAFPNVKHQLRPRKEEMLLTISILQHVVAWINPACALEIDDISPTAKDKPPICVYLLKTLSRMAAERGDDEYPDDAARTIQRVVLQFAEKHIAEIKALSPSTSQPLTLVDSPVYAQRFKHPVWARILRLVRRTTDTPGGPVLRSAWQMDCATRQVRKQDEMSIMVRGFCIEMLKFANHPGFEDPDKIQAVQQAVNEALARHLGATSDRTTHPTNRFGRNRNPFGDIQDPSVPDTDDDMFVSQDSTTPSKHAETTNQTRSDGTLASTNATPRRARSISLEPLESLQSPERRVEATKNTRIPPPSAQKQATTNPNKETVATRAPEWTFGPCGSLYGPIVNRNVNGQTGKKGQQGPDGSKKQC